MSYGKLFGYSHSAKLISSGTFSCPSCREEKFYRLRQNVLYFYLLFLPVVPIRDQDVFVECDQCKKQFEKRVLGFREKSLSRGDFQDAAIKLLIWYMIGFSKTDAVRIEACRLELGEMTGDDVPFEAVQMQIEKKMPVGDDAITRISRDSDMLNVEEKLQVLKRIRNIALSDRSELLDHEADFRRLSVALGFGIDQFDLVVSTLHD